MVLKLLRSVRIWVSLLLNGRLQVSSTLGWFASCGAVHRMIYKRAFACVLSLVCSATVVRSLSIKLSATPAVKLLRLGRKTQPPTALLPRSEEHTSELQSRPHLVCRLLLEKKKQDVRQ